MNLTATKTKGIESQLRAYIAESVREVLDDPDFGLELSAAAKRRLRATQMQPRKYVPLATVLKQYRAHV